MSRRILVAANWKMNKRPSDVPGWVDTLLRDLPGDAPADVALCVPFVHLPAARDAVRGSNVRTGAQDVSAHDDGAYTGEVAGGMLADLDVTFAIVGHSERRALHGEDDALVNAKVKAARRHGLVPILCVGETLEQREAGDAVRVVLGQLERGLEGVELADASEVVVAYEPVWAIGTGRTATAEDAQEICGEIRGALRRILPTHAEGTRILYGGSMKPDNARELFAQPDIDGGLVGGASLEVASLLGIVDGARVG